MKRSQRDTDKVPVHFMTPVVLAAGAGNLQLSPSGLSSYSTRLLAEADSWAHFRVLSLAFRIHPDTTVAAAQAAGFVGGVQDTLPTSVPSIMELLPSAYLGQRQTTPTDWIRVSQSELAGPLPWYKSVNGTSDTTEEAPGYLVFAGGGTNTVTLELKAVVQFKTSVAPANTPAAIALLRQRRSLREAVASARARETVSRVLTGARGPSANVTGGVYSEIRGVESLVGS